MAKSDPRPSSAAIPQMLMEGVGHYREGRHAEAEKICSRVLKLMPNQIDALHLLGVIRLDGGKPAAALVLFQSALKVDPASAAVLCNLGRALATLNRDEEALIALDKALASSPNSFEALNGRGIVLLKLNRATDALGMFERAARIEPRFIGSRMNLGNALAQLGRFEEALAEFEAVLASAPAQPDAHYGIGTALIGLGRHAEAIAAYDRALTLRPKHLKALISRGVARMALNHYQEALADFGAVLASDKNNADVQHNEALALLTLGDYRRGFEKYEHRWQRTGMAGRRRSLGKPLWLGEYPLQRKTILLHAEQGLGDTIQFVRYAPLLARAGAKVVLEVQLELAALLARTEGVAAVVTRGDALPPFDVHCPVGSLPRALRTEPSSIPANVPYLAASEERIAKWRERIARWPSPRIGIVWSGSASHPNDRNRSIALTKLAPVFRSEHGSFVSIQRDLRDGEREALASVPGLAHLGDDLEDFEDTAALVSLLDLVISVDTSVAHLAGALARPTWILTPFAPDWRWMLGREDSPWYPSVRLFRQSAPGDWDSVITRVRDELARV